MSSNPQKEEYFLFSLRKLIFISYNFSHKSKILAEHFLEIFFATVAERKEKKRMLEQHLKLLMDVLRKKNILQPAFMALLENVALRKDEK